MVSCGSIIFLLFHHTLLTLCVGFVIILSFLKILYSARLIMQYYIFILLPLFFCQLQLTANKEYGILCGNSTKSSMIFSTCTGLRPYHPPRSTPLHTKKSPQLRTHCHGDSSPACLLYVHEYRAKGNGAWQSLRLYDVPHAWRNAAPVPLWRNLAERACLSCENNRRYPACCLTCIPCYGA